MQPSEARFYHIGNALAGQGVLPGQLFSKPGLLFHGKAFAAFHHAHMVFKLPATAGQQVMSLSGVHLWDPSGKGRPMREWIAVPAEYQAQWHVLATKALHYLQASLASQLTE